MTQIGVNEPLSVKISQAASGALIAGVADKRIAVYGYVVVTTLGCSVTFEDSDGVDYAGPLPLAANGGVVAPTGLRPWFRLPVGKGLSMVLSLASATGGHVMYELES